MMSAMIRSDTEILSAISGRFRRLITGLLKGNIKRARALAAQVRREIPADGEHISFQNLIEDLAQGQAVRNAFINLPSAFPGIGTIISWALISLEDFFVLDQSVTLIMALCILHGVDPEDYEGMEEFAISVIGQAYGIETSGPASDSKAFVKRIHNKIITRTICEFRGGRGGSRFSLKGCFPSGENRGSCPSGLVS